VNSKVVTTCKNSIEAHLVKNKLENEGIKSYLINQNFSDLLPNFYGLLGSGVRVVVSEEDFEQANHLINQKGEIVCPSCGSNDIDETIGTKNGKIIAFIFLLFGHLIGNLLGNYKCWNCGNEFSK